MAVYGYVRVSTATQEPQRQIINILRYNPEAKIMVDMFSGRTFERPQWLRLLKLLEAGDTIIFDSVSRMSRTAERGFETYKQLIDKGISLIFLKEPTINSANYLNSMADLIPLQGTDADPIFEGINKYMRKLQEQQIKLAFEQSQKEVDDLRQRTSEGLKVAKAKGSQVGQVEGRKLNVKKAQPAKEKIKTHSKTFGGTLTDKDCIKLIGIDRNTYYKYKRELLEEQQQEQDARL